jgi:hypothetical protein
MIAEVGQNLLAIYNLETIDRLRLGFCHQNMLATVAQFLLAICTCRKAVSSDFFTTKFASGSLLDRRKSGTVLRRHTGTLFH